MTGYLSARGKCSVCTEELKMENNNALHFKTGAPFLTWRRKHAASVGAVLLDDLPEPLARAVVAHLTEAARSPNVTAA